MKKIQETDWPRVRAIEFLQNGSFRMLEFPTFVGVYVPEGSPSAEEQVSQVRQRVVQGQYTVDGESLKLSFSLPNSTQVLVLEGQFRGSKLTFDGEPGLYLARLPDGDE
jgi:hypothetical protein